MEKTAFLCNMNHAKPYLFILMALLPFLHGCEKYPENPNRPLLPYPITVYLRDAHFVDPSTNQWHSLTNDYDWVYINADIESTSRGIIVFHTSDYEFFAYDRMPPNDPDACTDQQGNTTRLIVDYPFVVDRCNNAYYNILNGQIIIREPDMVPSFPPDGTPVYNLIQYHTMYDGSKLVISN